MAVLVQQQVRRLRAGLPSAPSRGSTARRRWGAGMRRKHPLRRRARAAAHKVARRTGQPPPTLRSRWMMMGLQLWRKQSALPRRARHGRRPSGPAGARARRGGMRRGLGGMGEVGPAPSCGQWARPPPPVLGGFATLIPPASLTPPPSSHLASSTLHCSTSLGGGCHGFPPRSFRFPIR
jgi:hypothetical protein